LGLTVPYETTAIIVYVSGADQELDKWLWFAIITALIVAMGSGALSGEVRQILNGGKTTQ
jgi:hypothetical protein